MEGLLIQPGQVWVADLYGRKVRVLVIASHSEVPETWICEKLATGERTGTGPHLTLNERAFLRREIPIEKTSG